MGIEAAQSDQLVMRAVLRHGTVRQHGDVIRLLQRGDTVGDDNGGLVLAQPEQVFQNLFLGVRIDGGQGVVKDQNRGIL